MNKLSVAHFRRRTYDFNTLLYLIAQCNLYRLRIKTALSYKQALVGELPIKTEKNCIFRLQGSKR